MIVPTFALTIPRPWTWLVAEGARRDWRVRTDPSHLVNTLVALHSSSAGDADGWRRLDVWTEGRVERREVADRCPHSSIVGIAIVVRVDVDAAGWRVVFGRAAPIGPLGPIVAGELELWPVPARMRAQLRHALVGVQHRAAPMEARFP